MAQDKELSLPTQIAALAGGLHGQALDEKTRLEALSATRGLLAALESPVERVLQDVVMNGPILMAIRMGVQLEIFAQVSQSPEQGVTPQKIAEKTGASPILVDQIIRLLSATGYVNQIDAQTFKPSTLTMVMADPTMEATTRACFEIGNLCTSKAPEFFRRNNNQFPASAKDTPFQLGFNTDLSYFEWLGQNPELAKDFQQWMTMKQKVTPNWVDWFDIQQHIIDGFKGEFSDNVLLVDIGGGEGHYTRNFKEKFPTAPGRLILQDLPQVISAIESPPPGVELTTHDFFTPQPVKGARTYFMHWILHDWSDEHCRSILSHIVDVMEPGYSRLIIHETILPDTDCDLPSACMSIMMMVQVAAFERSEKQWRDLLESVGLRKLTFYQPPAAGEVYHGLVVGIGRKRTPGIVTGYVNDSDAGIIMFDLTRKATLQSIMQQRVMVNEHYEQDETFWAPGTVALEDIDRTRDQLVLFPTPTADPNDPLNWSTARKALNFSLVSFFVLWTFVQLDIGFTAWGPMETELGFSVDILNAGAAVNYGGLAIGCFFFIPLVHKYGRRPVYIFSSALQFASCVWQAKVYTVGGFIGSNLISGLGGAISEIVVQITVADMFFVHQHATMNGWFMIFQSAGAFLGPVASGYIVDSQGWRWMWWWCVIFFGVTLICVIFLFEESKFVPVVDGQGIASPSQTSLMGPEDTRDKKTPGRSTVTADVVATRVATNPDIKPKTYRQRMALVTVTDESLWPHFWNPIVTLSTYPAVAYAAITYGSTLAWFAIMTSLQASYMLLPPYNFGAIGVGLMNLAPFVGAVIGFPCGGYLSDKHILWLSKKNGGVYEPEMRLWLALPIAILGPGSILMFGLGLAYEVHWSLLAVGFGVFGFTLASISGISLSYLMDCYQDVIGDALVGVIFVRNIISVIVLFVLTPWVDGMGLRNLHILAAVLAFALYMIPVPLLVWGKKARIATAASYRKMAAKQVSHRTV
ncbi:uncharacterized protein N7459_002607 [Penicillium hispanicum]|uniref:uncharacterized protein n=1 Tax=Penicillium hispanicum TaxID=1080232 RepID=UPI00253F84A5|nr:uncharacterized protein N7459_002607 [Penicillium hispanicum]KAJ5586842.1 hypothetical protein N7459_002607 [Penicillium hispanicum]